MDNKNKNKEIHEKSKITIENNVLKFEDTVIQLSNISRVHVAPIPKDHLANAVLAGILFGLFGLWCFTVNAWIGTVTLGLDGVFLYYIYIQYQGTGKYLILELNSGNIILFSCYNMNFLSKALEQITEAFNGNRDRFFINFGNCQIGDNNAINARENR